MATLCAAELSIKWKCRHQIRGELTLLSPSLSLHFVFGHLPFTNTLTHSLSLVSQIHSHSTFCLCISRSCALTTV